MKLLNKLRWLLLALIPVLAQATAVSPYGIFGGAGTFAQLPGNSVLTFTAAPTGASATLASSWPGTATSIVVVFSDWESRTVTVANGATTASWTGSLTGTPTATATVDGNTTPPGAGTFAFTSDLGVVASNGTIWGATQGSIIPPQNISSGCTTISAGKGNALQGQFTTTATTCTPVLQLPPSFNGWVCQAQDITSGHAVVFTQTASNTYTCTVTGTTTSGDVVQYSADPY